ncbi:MAG: glycosyltransferase family 2 protein, partial [Proteobacteria bacterium]|nr:glycosyltransferase family 2 protein [Pseudomonadota bacterium]
ITWRNRRFGVAKLKIAEMGSRYLFICLYVWLEKTLSRGDYKKSVSSTPLALPEAETASSAKTP